MAARDEGVVYEDAMCRAQRVVHAPGVVEYTVQRKTRGEAHVVRAVCLAVTAAAVVYASAPRAAGVWTLCAMAVAAGVFAVLSLRRVTEESLLVAARVGVQAARRGVCMRGTSVFHPWSKVRSAFIHEHITCCDIATYLAFAVAGEAKLCVPFEKTAPPVGVLKDVWRECDTLLCGAGE